jgi:iron complex transport system substrate-binding protein
MRPYRVMRFLALFLLTLLPLTAARATVSVVDDTARTVTLREPARRIISLAPHTTEMLYAAGAGDHVVGVVDYSDFPPEAKHIPSVGSGIALDLERIVQLKPDLVVAWSSGNSAAQIARLRALGIPVFESEPRDFDAIASSLERLAHLAGTDAAGQAAASTFRERLRKLAAAYRHRPTVTVFYQIWRKPLMTLNGTHPVSRALRICGGENIFGKLPQLAPTVGIEAVLQANPDAIIASNGSGEDVLSDWRRFPQLKAVARGNLIAIDGSVMNRSGPRILDGVEELCRQLDRVRDKKH